MKKPKKKKWVKYPIDITIPLSKKRFKHELDEKFIYLSISNTGIWLQLYLNYKHNYGKWLYITK